MVNNRLNNGGGGGSPCRFGPGGEFVQDWPGEEAKQTTITDNPIGRVLATIAEMIGATIEPNLFGEITDPGNIEVTINKKSVTEDSTGADKQPHLHHAPAAGCAKIAWPNGGQATLFADDRRAGRKTRRKSNHRIRAYRGTSRKRANQQIEGQGTLFEVNSPSQSAA